MGLPVPICLLAGGRSPGPRADSGVVFCLGVVACCGTGGLPPIRARALCGASTARPVRGSLVRRWLLSVGFVRSRGVVAADRTLYVPGRALIEPLALLPLAAEAVGLFGCGAPVTAAGESFPKIRCVIDPGVAPCGLA